MRLPPPRIRLAAPLAAWAALAACGEPAPPAAPVVEVVVAPVAQRDVGVTSEWIGTTEGSVDAEVRAQVSGYLVERPYREGTRVRAGELLFRIDPRPYRAALEQARGELGQAEAALGKARLDVARYTPLAAQGAVSQQELDNAVQAARAGEASVHAARAALDKAELDLAFTEIRSPIDGIAGVARRQLGDLVGPGDPEPLTGVSQVDPIRVSFPLSEREYLSFAHVFRESVEGGTRGPDGTLELVLADGNTWPHRGTGVPASERVDPSTGTLLIRGEFSNPEGILRPGQYARVRAVTERREGALLVPQRAVTELQGVQQVAVVGPADRVSMRVVQTGPRDGSDWVIESGVAAGERVVIEGLQRVREGAVVLPKAAAAEPPGAPDAGA